MATGTKLALEFTDATGTSRKFSYSYIDQSAATRNRIIALMNGMITNGSIFAHVPATKKAAKLVTTSETIVEIDDE